MRFYSINIFFGVLDFCQGGKHAGNRGGIRLRFHEEPRATQCPVFLQRNEGGRDV